MIAVVTGSSGFIGSHLVDALLARGATVRALVRAESSVRKDSRVEYWTVDLLDTAAVRACDIWVGATHVFHVGGVTKRRSLAEFRDGNVIPTTNILAAISARANNLQRFVLISSQTAAGPAHRTDRPVIETDEPRPIEAYGRSKLEAEQVTLGYAHEIPVVVLRVCAVYGPRDVDFLSIFKQATAPVAVHAAPSDQRMSILHVDDVVRALLLAAEKPAARGHVYFVGSELSRSWHELYAMIGEIAGRRPLEIQLPAFVLSVAGWSGSLFSLMTGKPVLVNSNKVALSRPKWWLCDSSRIRSELGWTDEVSIMKGMHGTYLWYVDNGHLRPGAEV